MRPPPSILDSAVLGGGPRTAPPVSPSMMPVPLARDPTVTTATLCSPVSKRHLQHRTYQNADTS